jgi:hypothetical protein
MAGLFNITTDCADPPVLAAFWSQVLGIAVDEGANEFVAVLPGTPNWLFLKVPEPKVAKNRVHVDLECPLHAERDRLIDLGATFVHEKHEYGIRWMTFQDP